MKEGYNIFIVVDSDRLFGWPWKEPDIHSIICAKTHFDAKKRYIKKWAQRHKQLHPYYDICYAETTEKWGRLKVKNVKTGWKTYWGR